MCAVDALGIPLMAGGAGEGVQSTSLGTEVPVRLVFQGGRLVERSPQSTAVVVAHGQGASIAESTCRFVLFSASRDEGRRWLTDRPALRGTVLPLRAALLLARRVFNDRFAPPF